MHEPYPGLRPHVEAAVADGGADPNRVIRDSTLARLDHLLCAADEHARYGRIDAARATIEGARCHLAEVDAIARAAKSAFDEACSRCEAAAARLDPPPEPTPDETMADPDRVPTEENASFNLPAEGEAGQEAVTEDSQYGNPEDAIDRTDPPPEDDPPLGRKGRRR
jgi:hypothetical protein